MTTCAGCTTYKVIPADKTVIPLRAGEALKAPFDGWYVPDARYQEMRQAISDKIKDLETGK